ncbi:MAG: hypothetical protein HY848_10515 [Betaproteobacteria bacterium]|nr:hypothetical protein [Betaproteobacteria bacterium]
MASTLNRRQTSQGMRALFSAFFPVQASLTVARGKGPAISAPVRARSGATRPDTPSAPSRLKQGICQALVVVALASGMGGLLAAYNLRDSIQAQAQQWAMVIAR